MSEAARNIQQSILAAMREAAEKGISKRMQADLGGAKVRYRGIEDAMNEMCAVLVHCGITVAPEYSEITITERDKGGGKATRFATVKGSFTFTADDLSHVRCSYYGEAMDSGDKAVTKAQSVAFRTALFQTFVVPTVATAIDPEADGDGDDDDGSGEPKKKAPARRGRAPEVAQTEFDKLLKSGQDAATGGSKAVTEWWGQLSGDQRNLMNQEFGKLKRDAAAFDRPIDHSREARNAR